MIALPVFWKNLCAKYGASPGQTQRLWGEVEAAYGSKWRYYHNFNHVHALLKYAEHYREKIRDGDVLGWSIFYHDIVYSALRKDNEIRSAQLAEKRLTQLGVPAEAIRRCTSHIKATATHTIPPASEDPDLPWFLDFDLAVLGADREMYQIYARKIRREYRIFPGWMYRKGRKKVISHFLDRDRLYFTDTFYDRYESKARKNLQEELESLVE